MMIIISLNGFKKDELSSKTDIIATRIETMNNFIKDVEQDLEKGLFISGFRAFASMVQFVANNGSYIDDVDISFNELIINGSLNGQYPGLMIDSTFTDWVGKIESQADKIGILVNFTILDIEINQTGPWLIEIVSNVNLLLVDKKNTSSWNRTRIIRTSMNIETLEDPVYIVNSGGKITNTIVKSPIIDFVQGSNTDNLNIHLNNSYYIKSNTSPSFLMRLEGNLGNSTNGIESLVNLQEFQDQGLPIKDRSVVDYIYFGVSQTTNSMVNGTPAWFKLDVDHHDVYEVEDLLI